VCTSKDWNLILVCPHSQSIYHHSKSVIFLVDSKYRICMIQLEHNWILVKDGTSLHHSIIQRKWTYTTQFKENRQCPRETFCGTPIGGTELSKWIPEAAAGRLGRRQQPRWAAPEHVITTTTPLEKEHNLRMESAHAFKRRSEPSRVRRERNRHNGLLSEARWHSEHQQLH
jgi:hypothetical protein